MILADTSAWVRHFRGQTTELAALLQRTQLDEAEDADEQCDQAGHPHSGQELHAEREGQETAEQGCAHEEDPFGRDEFSRFRRNGAVLYLNRV